MSTIRVNNIQTTGGADNFSPGTITTLQSGMADAWVNFNGTGTVSIRSSYNVSSITDNGVGDYTVNFSTAFADANYTFTWAGGKRFQSWGIFLQHESFDPAAGSHRFRSVTTGDGATDSTFNCLAYWR